MYPENPILIIDDEVRFLNVVRIALRTAGITNVVTCCDSREVCKLLGDDRYSLILLDLTMPHISGTELLHYIESAYPGMPVIIITASTEFETAAGCVSQGIYDYLVKPVDKARLVDRIRRALDRRRPNGSKLIKDLLLSARFDITEESCRDSCASCNCRILRQTRAAYQSLFNEIHIPMFIATGDEFTITYCNRALVNFFGFSDPSSLVEKSVSLLDCLDEPDKAKLCSGLRNHNKIKSFELHGRRNNGEQFWVVLNCRADEMGEYIEGSFIDITQQKQLEQQLRQSQKMEALGRMAGGIAHDFNNIIAVIKGYIDMLLTEEQIPAQTAAGLLEIKKANQRASEMTQQLLSFSRKPSIVAEPVHLDELIRESNKMLLRLIRTNISLCLELNAEYDRVTVCPGQIEQILINLILNAVHAMPEGGRIEISTENYELREQKAGQLGGLQAGIYFLMRVADNGCGMDGQTKEKAFDPFFTTKAEGQGTGLGLSTVFGIVKNCSGAVEIESEVGRGTRINIYLPIESQRTYEELQPCALAAV
jgi:two-component system cell cycle sensor histidine kinase/response regulator CckA